MFQPNTSSTLILLYSTNLQHHIFTLLINAKPGMVFVLAFNFCNWLKKRCSNIKFIRPLVIIIVILMIWTHLNIFCCFYFYFTWILNCAEYRFKTCLQLLLMMMMMITTMTRTNIKKTIEKKNTAITPTTKTTMKNTSTK